MRTSVVAISACMAIAGAPPAFATDLAGQSSSFALFSSLVATTYTLNFAPTPTVAGSAPAPYSLNDFLPSSSHGAAANALDASGTVSASAASNVDGTSGSKSTSASTFADGAIFTVGGTVIVFNAGVVATNGLSVQGDSGALTSSGYADFSGATLSVLGTPYLFTTTPSPNTVMYNAGGLRIVANDQTVTGDGITSRGISITALDFTFTNFAYGSEVLNGEVQFSHAQAAMTATPEPVSLAGLAAFGLALIRPVAAGKATLTKQRVRCRRIRPIRPEKQMPLGPDRTARLVPTDGQLNRGRVRQRTARAMDRKGVRPSR
ncbi:MAG: hypothetical protein ACYC96_12100 [Fimbriimonadaceae bacterium]